MWKYTKEELEEYEKENAGLYDEMERTRLELEELKKQIERTGIGPEDDWELREEYNEKALAYAYALDAYKDYWNNPRHHRFHSPR